MRAYSRRPQPASRPGLSIDSIAFCVSPSEGDSLCPLLCLLFANHRQDDDPLPAPAAAAAAGPFTDPMPTLLIQGEPPNGFPGPSLNAGKFYSKHPTALAQSRPGVAHLQSLQHYQLFLAVRKAKFQDLSVFLIQGSAKRNVGLCKCSNQVHFFPQPCA